MPASIIASFLSFIVTGIYTFWLTKDPFPMPYAIKIAVFTAILVNAFYFFYFEAVTEINEESRAKLKTIGRTEWYLRIVNQTLLFSLWFLFELHPLAFCGGLICLYLLYLWWDLMTKTCFNDNKLLWLDTAGLIVSVFFVLFSYLKWRKAAGLDGVSTLVSPDYDSVNFFWGGCVLAYIAIPVIGVIRTDFILFQTRYWTREGIS